MVAGGRVSMFLAIAVIGQGSAKHNACCAKRLMLPADGLRPVMYRQIGVLTNQPVRTI